MKKRTNEKSKLENLDDLLVGEPKNIEKNLKKLIPAAKALPNKSIYLQILSQIALAQALQKKFKSAHKTLDKAEKDFTLDNNLARARIILERGRVFHQSDNIKTALRFFKHAYKFSKKHKLDYHALDAAHMIPIVIKSTSEKIKWNKIAITLAKKTKDKRAHEFLPLHYNDLGRAYLQAKKYNEALASYRQSKKITEKKKKYFVITLEAKWGIARSLRSLNFLDESLNIQLALLDEYNNLSKKGIIQGKLLVVVRGQVYEELAEIYVEKVKKFSALAHHNLSKDAWPFKLPERLEKMKRLYKIS